MIGGQDEYTLSMTKVARLTTGCNEDKWDNKLTCTRARWKAPRKSLSYAHTHRLPAQTLHGWCKWGEEVGFRTLILYKTRLQMSSIHLFGRRPKRLRKNNNWNKIRLYRQINVIFKMFKIVYSIALNWK